MTEYSANDLEREVLDPLFYRYEKSLRAQVRLEREVAALKHECAQLCAAEAKLTELTRRNATLQSTIDLTTPKLKALYDGARAFLIEVRGHPQKNRAQRKHGVAAAEVFLRQALLDAYPYCGEVPF